MVQYGFTRLENIIQSIIGLYNPSEEYPAPSKTPVFPAYLLFFNKFPAFLGAFFESLSYFSLSHLVGTPIPFVK